MDISDQHLIEEFTDKGDHKAFSLLVERYIDVAYSAAITVLACEDLARDACQLTFITLAQKIKKFPPSINLGGWVYTTSRNFSRKIQRSEIRRLRREQTYLERVKKEDGNEKHWELLVVELHNALEQIKPNERELILFRFFQGRSYAEIGEIFNLTSDAVRMRLNRALESLNNHLSRKGISSTTAAISTALPANAWIAAPKGLGAIISSGVSEGLLAAGGSIVGITTVFMKGAVLAKRRKMLRIRIGNVSKEKSIKCS